MGLYTFSQYFNPNSRQIYRSLRIKKNVRRDRANRERPGRNCDVDRLEMAMQVCNYVRCEWSGNPCKCLWFYRSGTRTREGIRTGGGSTRRRARREEVEKDAATTRTMLWLQIRFKVL